jgi:hypothetical protein
MQDSTQTCTRARMHMRDAAVETQNTAVVEADDEWQLCRVLRLQTLATGAGQCGCLSLPSAWSAVLAPSHSSGACGRSCLPPRRRLASMLDGRQ